MTNEEILKLAREAGINDHFLWSPIMVQMQCGSWSGIIESLEKFAALVAAAEREECAKICDEECRTAFAYSFPDALASLEDVAKKIRNREVMKS